MRDDRPRAMSVDTSRFRNPIAAARRRSGTRADCVGLACVLFLFVHASVVLAVDGAPPPFRCRYRLADIPDDPGFRPLARTAILTGRVEFLVTPHDPARYDVRGLEVLDETAMVRGRTAPLCAASRDDPGRCMADFGTEVLQRALTISTRLHDQRQGVDRVVSMRVTTLRTMSERRAALVEGVMRDHAEARRYPPDQVRRAVRVTRSVGSGRDRRAVTLRGLTLADFEATARGVSGVQVIRVTPPQKETRCMVPVAWNATPHLESTQRGLVWSEDHRPLVLRIREGLEAAARHGYGCDTLVAEYAAYARPLFGPFRLHPGDELRPGQREQNDETLDDLQRHLLRDPPADWARRTPRAGRTEWKSAFGSVYATLNDLLRGTAAKRSVLLLTDGRDDPLAEPPSFQRELWPSRLDELNSEWSPARFARFLGRLDTETSAVDERLAGFLSELNPKDPGFESKVLGFIADLDPGGLASLHPHRKDIWPNVDVLLLPTRRPLRRGTALAGWIPSRGGRLWQLPVIRPRNEVEEKVAPVAGELDDTLTFAEALLEVQRDIEESYTVELLIPNRRQDRRAHELQIDVVERATDSRGNPTVRSRRDLELRYVSAYHSSPPAADKLPVFAASPFKILRLQAAYDFRREPFDDRLSTLLQERRRAEPDEQVRRLLLESWLSVQLQRLQTDENDVGNRRRRARYIRDACTNLDNLTPAQLPDPPLAAEARRVARWARGDLKACLPVR